jgi:uncharacterized iron-regulated protein
VLEEGILRAVKKHRKKVALSLEMFERDVQGVLDGYLEGIYMERHFLQASRPWPGYATDYRPMVEFAKKHGIPVLAANAPRRLVNLVSRRGAEALTSLPDSEKRWLPPLPYHIPQEGRYVEKLSKVFSDAMAISQDQMPWGLGKKRDWAALGNPSKEDYLEMIAAKVETSHGPPQGMPPHGMMMRGKNKGNPAQSLWDAAMAHSIACFLDEHPEHAVVQVNGAFHSDEHLGTVEQLTGQYRPGTKVAVISILPDPNFPTYDRENLSRLGDVVIITDPSWQPRD